MLLVSCEIHGQHLLFNLSCRNVTYDSHDVLLRPDDMMSVGTVLQEHGFCVKERKRLSSSRPTRWSKSTKTLLLSENLCSAIVSAFVTAALISSQVTGVTRKLLCGGFHPSERSLLF